MTTADPHPCRPELPPLLGREVSPQFCALMAPEDEYSTAFFPTSHEGKLPKQLCWRQGSKHWWCVRAQRVRCSCSEVILQPSWWERRLQRPARCVLFTCQSKASHPGALIIRSSVPCTWSWRRQLERGGRKYCFLNANSVLGALLSTYVGYLTPSSQYSK